MVFIARLKKSSHIYSTWRGARRIQGVVGNGTFRLAPNFEYVTGVLTPDEVDDLRHHPSVQVEMVSVVPEAVETMAPLEPPVGVVMSDGTVKPVQAPTSRPIHQEPHRKGHRR